MQRCSQLQKFEVQVNEVPETCHLLSSLFGGRYSRLKRLTISEQSILTGDNAVFATLSALFSQSLENHVNFKCLFVAHPSSISPSHTDLSSLAKLRSLGIPRSSELGIPEFPFGYFTYADIFSDIKSTDRYDGVTR